MCSGCSCSGTTNSYSGLSLEDCAAQALEEGKHLFSHSNSNGCEIPVDDSIEQCIDNRDESNSSGWTTYNVQCRKDPIILS